MSSKYVMDTVWAYLTASWVETKLEDVENLFAQVGGDPITEWTTLVSNTSIEQQVSLGAPGDQRWREEGTLALVAFVPSGTGSARALALAEMLRDLFRAKQIDDGAGGPVITFRQAEPPDQSLPSAVDASSGAWYGYAIVVPYYVDFCR